MEAAGSYYVGSLAAANTRASWAWRSKHTNSHRVGLESASRQRSSRAQVCMSLTRAGIMHAAARRADTNESTASVWDGGALRIEELGGSRRRVIGLLTGIAPHNDVHRTCILPITAAFQPISRWLANTRQGDGAKAVSFKHGNQYYADTAVRA